VPDLTDLEHLVLLIAEQVPVDGLAGLDGLSERMTTCRAYHLTPEGEERAERLWPAYAVVLRETGYTVHLRASMPDTLGDVTVIEASRATVEAVIGGLDDLPPNTLLAVALAGGEASPVVDETGALGGSGVLLLRTPWASRDWVSDEVCDHTSLMQLCERWTAARGREARARLTAWRRRVCGDLVGALDLGGDPDPGAPAVRPAPYAPEAEVRTADGRPVLVLRNAGPAAARAAHLVVDDGVEVSRHTVPASGAERPKELVVPIAVTDGRYDVTVTGPAGFRRRLVPDDLRE
jgi:hypothetical protein